MQWLQENAWSHVPNGGWWLLGAAVLMVGVCWILRCAMLGRRQGSQMEIVESKSLGNRHHLMVIRYRQNCFLLGVSPHGIRFLCTLEKESKVDSGIGDAHKNIDTPV